MLRPRKGLHLLVGISVVEVLWLVCCSPYAVDIPRTLVRIQPRRFATQVTSNFFRQSL